ncbi:MAG: hypothetical protein V1936_01845 [Patescibacteria group bacterium]
MPQKNSLQNLFASATIVFATVTAIVLLLTIWWLGKVAPELAGRLVGTSITLAALSFVLFLVATFAKK